MKKFVLMCFSFGFALSVWAQDRVVSGRVASKEDNSPLPGVNVVIKGTTSGTVTDADGKYTLSVPPGGGSLVFSFIGLKSEEIEIGERSIVDVQLGLDVTQLTEVVVTGVGVATDKKKVAIDVATLNDKDIPKSAVASIDQALQGKIAGAQIRINSGEPGAPVNIQLRGINSLGSTQPMIMIDGVQVPEGNASSALTSLDMTNVERFEVVKGAAAGMLYGAQGANGVIQIFTKKGTKGSSPEVTVSSKAVFGTILRGDTPLTASNHAFQTDTNGFIVTGGGVRVAPSNLGVWSQPGVLDANIDPTLQNNKPYKERTYDHLSQAYRSTVSQNTTVNIRGGTEKLDYNVNVNWLNQQSALNSSLDRKNIGVNLGIEVVKNFKIRSITQAIIQSEGLISGNRFNMVNTFPFIDFTEKDTTGYYAFRVKTVNGSNPLSQPQWRTRSSKDTRIVQSFNFNYKFNRFVELDYTYGIQIYNTESSDAYKNQDGRDVFWGPSKFGSLTRQYNRSTFQNSIFKAFVRTDFVKDFGMNLPITTLTQFAYDWRKDDSGSFFAQGTIFPAFPPQNLNTSASTNVGDNYSQFITYGYLINQTIDYKNVAGISGGFRSDYSSEFGFNNTNIKPFTFPRGTVYFRPIEFINAPMLGEWKIRAAYGEAGIQPYRYARQRVAGIEGVGTSSALYNPIIVNNPNLQVQLSKEFETGMDFTLFPSTGSWFSKVDISGTYFTRTSDQVIQNASNSLSSGGSVLVSNLVGLESHGVDLTIDSKVYTGSNLDWNFGIRFGQVVTNVKYVANHLPVIYGDNGTYSIREGTPIGSFFGQYVVSSLDSKNPVTGTPYVPAATAANYVVAKTQYGDIVMDRTTNKAVISASNDKILIGNPQPKFTMSFINNFTIKRDLNVSFQIDWWYGQDIYNQTRQWLYLDGISKDFDLKVTPTSGEAPGSYVATYNSLYNSLNPLKWYVEKGSFARLRDVSVSYNLNKFFKIKKLRQASLVLSGRNLFTITNYRGLDPEAVTAGIAGPGGNNNGDNTSVSSNVANPIGPARGIDSFSFPNLRTYQVGLTIGF